MQLFDTYAAFQEVSMFVGGVLPRSTKPMIEISDEDKAHKKGHGGKYSFRTPPKKKK